MKKDGPEIAENVPEISKPDTPEVSFGESGPDKGLNGQRHDSGAQGEQEVSPGKPIEFNLLSLVIPVFNEVESLPELHKEISEVAEKNDYTLEIVFVDDGSSDGSWDAIKKLREVDSRVRGLRFRRNFGKAAGLDAGFSAAKGDVIVTLDADLQDDPNEIPDFLNKMGQGFDVVSGWKKVRHDPWHKVYPSRVFNWMVSSLTGVKLHDHNCGMKSYRSEIFKEVQLYGELHRFVPVLAAARGWTVGEKVVAHRARKHGYSKYGVHRFVKGFMDLMTVKFVTGFGNRPQHFLGTFGLISFGLGSVFLLLLTLAWVLTRLDGDVANNIHLHERALFYYAIFALLLGTQFISVGFLAELVNSRHHRPEDAYAVSETLDTD